jgi:hypothetical protein
MSRHAGFAAAATITEDAANAVIASYSRDALGLFFFPLPATVDIGSRTVTFGGVARMLPPVLELRANPDDLVRVHFAFESTLSASVEEQPWTLRRRVRLSGSADLGVISAVQGDRIALGIDTGEATFQPLAVDVLQGPPLPPPAQTALRSEALAAAATAFVRGLPPITISPPLLSSRLNFTQPLELPHLMDSDWFSIDLSASRIVVRTLEKALTVAVDFAGFTAGNEQELVDLTTVEGTGRVYTAPITSNFDPAVGPVLTTGQIEPKGGSVAVALNMGFVAAVVSQEVSWQVRDTPIVPRPPGEVALMSIDLRWSLFHKPLRGWEDALALEFQVLVKEGPWFGVDGAVYIQAYRPVAYEGLPVSEAWTLHVAKVDLDLPAWLPAALVGATVYLAAFVPVISPILGVALAGLLDGVVPSLLASVEGTAQQQLSQATGAAAFPEDWEAPLPGLSEPLWAGGIRYVSVAPDSIDVALDWWPRGDFEADPIGTITPRTWDVTDRAPIPLRLKLRSDFEAIAPDLMVSWTVRRADTNEVVASGNRTYDDPSGNGIAIPHHSAELYHVDTFVVRCRATLTLENQVGDVWSGQATVTMTDYLDRHRKYVQWGPHEVWFQHNGWQRRNRTSRIHRTAVSARCRSLPLLRPEVVYRYTDALPFPWTDLNQHRLPLCEYCFFGGPDKEEPLPEEDWF